MNLEDSLKAFHTPKPEGWGHSTKPRVFQAINRAKKLVTQEGHKFTEQDILDLTYFLHGAWDRLIATNMVFPASEKELHSIIIARLERGYEQEKKDEHEAAKRIMKRLDNGN